MSSRIAQLAARLDALAQVGSVPTGNLRVARWGCGLAIPLSPTVVEALALREGDEITVRVPDGNSLTVVIRRPDPDPANQPR